MTPTKTPEEIWNAAAQATQEALINALQEKIRYYQNQVGQYPSTDRNASFYTKLHLAGGLYKSLLVMTPLPEFPKDS